MRTGKHHQVWIEKCEAARTIRERIGLKAAFDYVVGEKLMNFASVARVIQLSPGASSICLRSAAPLFGRRNSYPTCATRMRAE
jgi:hypothetical protein